MDPSEDEQEALMVACELGHVDIVRLLSINICNTTIISI